ncbi:MAG: DUF362 domain-containing protein [Armatimonadota bacterium]
MATVAVVKVGEGTENIVAACRQAISISGGLKENIRPGWTVLVKPNLVAPVPAAVTNFDVLAAVVQEIIDAGATPVIGDCSGFEYDSYTTFDILGIRDLAQQLGVEVVNFEEDRYIEVPFDHPRIRRVKIAATAVESEAIVNVPKMKCHKLTDVSLAIKNCFGMLHKSSRREVHAKGLDAGIAALYKLFRPVMSVMEGLVIPVSGAVYGEYMSMGVIAASTDMLALDLFASKLLGFERSDVKHLKLAARGRSPLIDIAGDEVEPVDIAAGSSKLRKNLYRHLYATVYASDHYLSNFGVKSLIPWFHSRFGIHPVIDWKRCSYCDACAAACPVNAIDIESEKLDYGQCSKARCLMCVNMCPNGAVTIKQSFKS